jgi:hypothetical protein
MAIKKINGHGTTSVLSGTDHTVVKPVNLKFPAAVTQNGKFPKG